MERLPPHARESPADPDSRYEFAARNIYLGRDGQTLGPYSDQQLRKFLAEGRVADNDLVWREGKPDWRPVSEVVAALAPENTGTAPAPAALAIEPSLPVVAYHHVAPLKFAILSVATLGVYELFWFYKNWKFVRQRDQSRIRRQVLCRRLESLLAN